MLGVPSRNVMDKPNFSATSGSDAELAHLGDLNWFLVFVQLAEEINLYSSEPACATAPHLPMSHISCSIFRNVLWAIVVRHGEGHLIHRLDILVSIRVGEWRRHHVVVRIDGLQECSHLFRKKNEENNIEGKCEMLVDLPEISGPVKLHWICIFLNLCLVPHRFFFGHYITYLS